MKTSLPERTPANDDETQYAYGECDLSFDELLDVLRAGGAEVNIFAIPGEGPAIPIAND